MSVIIKGMKMPESCFDCQLYDDEEQYCKAQNGFLVLLFPSRARDTSCPLVDVPTPHGKLVEFIDVATQEDDDTGMETVNLGEAFSAYFRMREAPAIIEAEGE